MVKIHNLFSFLDASIEMNDYQKLFRALIKTYTNEACYKNISLSLVNGMHEKAHNYIYLLLSTLPHIGNKYEYKAHWNPLYRGVLREYVNLDDYRINRVHYWPAFSSSSKDHKVALQMARRGKGKKENVVIFEIFVSN